MRAGERAIRTSDEITIDAMVRTLRDLGKTDAARFERGQALYDAGWPSRDVIRLADAVEAELSEHDEDRQRIERAVVALGDRLATIRGR